MAFPPTSPFLPRQIGIVKDKFTLRQIHLSLPHGHLSTHGPLLPSLVGCDSPVLHIPLSFIFIVIKGLDISTEDV